ncbi:MAG: hypothetical protein IJR29_01105 [Butyrivibrio sp.]|nr:hypothetical protein [Butyrivibrio sp.]
MFKNELEIDVFRCFRALLKKAKFILLITLLFFVGGIALTLNVGKDIYSAVATVYAAADGSYSDSSNAVTVMNAYLNVASSYKVCQRAALLMGRSDIDAADIQKAIGVSSSAKNSTSTNFMASSATIISFYASSEDSDLAMEIADAMAESYTIEMANILDNNSVKVLDSAYESYISYNAHIEAWKDRIKFAALGFVLACFVVVICEILDWKVRTIREATVRGQIPVIGIIPDYKE